MDNYSRSESPWFNNSTITTVRFTEGITSIGEYAFYNCSALKQVELPASLDSIGAMAFYDCDALTEITIPESITYIKSSAFDKSGLTSVVWNAKNCGDAKYSPFPSELTSITFGSEVKRIPAYLCQYTAVTDVTIPATVESIGDKAFYECKSLNKLTFEASSALREIGSCAFYNCPLKNSDYKLPDNIKFIGEDAFSINFYDDSSYINELTITQAMVSAGYNTNIKNIGTLVLADDLRHIDFTEIFPLSNINDVIPNVTRIEGHLPDSITSWDLPINDTGTHPHDCFETVYDVNGTRSFLNGKSYGNLIRNIFGFFTDTLQLTLHDSDLYEWANLNNDNSIDILSRIDSNATKYISSVWTKTNDKYTKTLQIEHEQYDHSYYDVLDFNGDGLPDMVTDDQIWLQQRNGSFLHTELQSISPEEVSELLAQEDRRSGGLLGMSASVALSFNNIVSGSSPTSTSTMPARIAMDIDCNGYPDMLELKTGNVIFNYGNNRIARGRIGTRILDVKDLNGDGVSDLLVYDEEDDETVYLFMYVDGQITRKELTTALIPSNAWCYDFDRDGDVDILLTFDYQKSMGWSFLIFYRNDGNNTFKKKETAFEEPLYFSNCIDTNNDGLYEIIGYIIDNYNSHDFDYYYLIHCNEEFTVELADGPFISSYRTMPPFFGDLDGDGYVEYSYGEEQSRYHMRRIKSALPNTPPARMEAPNAVYDGTSGKLNVSWGLGSDAETSPVDLTYALRIGSAPGKGNMLYAHATADGKRLNLQNGNMGYSLSTWMDVANWPTGKYYLSVQAVDANHMGGAWSEETVYTHNTLSADFNIDRPNLPSSDTLTSFTTARFCQTMTTTGTLATALPSYRMKTMYGK